MAYFFSIKVKMFSNLGPYIFPASFLQLVHLMCGERDGGGVGWGWISSGAPLRFFLSNRLSPSPFS